MTPKRSEAQLDKIYKAWSVLEGFGIYKRETKSEPTSEQLKKIQQSYHLAKLNRELKSRSESTLLNKYSSKLMSLGLLEEYGGVQFEQFRNDNWSV